MEWDVAQTYRERLQHASIRDILVLAFTNHQVQSLNQVIRSSLKASHVLPEVDVLSLNNRHFALGDKVVFLKNDRFYVSIHDAASGSSSHRLIQNGATGLLESVSEKGDVVLRLSDHVTAHFNKANYAHLDYGYELTTHQSQDKTIQHTI